MARIGKKSVLADSAFPLQNAPECLAGLQGAPQCNFVPYPAALQDPQQGYCVGAGRNYSDNNLKKL